MVSRHTASTVVRTTAQLLHSKPAPTTSEQLGRYGADSRRTYIVLIVLSLLCLLCVVTVYLLELDGAAQLRGEQLGFDGGLGHTGPQAGSHRAARWVTGLQPPMHRVAGFVAASHWDETETSLRSHLHTAH